MRPLLIGANMKKIVLVCLTLCLLTGCHKKIIKYTDEDVSQYNLKTTKSSKAKMVDVKKVNKDTIWTFQESYTRALQWQTIDHHYTDSTSHYEKNNLMTNYQTIVIDYYLNRNQDMQDTFSISYSFIDGFKNEIYFSSPYSSRENLKQLFDKLSEFQEAVSTENSNYSEKNIDYKMNARFSYKDIVQLSTNEFDDFETIDSKNLMYAYVYQDNDMLQEYTDDEIKTFLKDNENQIYVRENEDESTWYPTDYYTLDHTLAIASTVLYDMLQLNSIEGVTIDGERDNYTIVRDDSETRSFQDEMIPFIQAQEITGLQFNVKKNVEINQD